MVVLLAATVLVLGTIGFHQYDKRLDFIDSLYRAVQLFGFGATLSRPPSIPTTLQIARILGPLVAGYAIIRGLILLSREQLQLLWFRIFLRNHIVVVGLGTAGFRLATTLHAEGFNVVAIERSTDNPAIQGCRERGIGVVKGDATDQSILRRARVDRAARLVVTTGADAANIDVATAAGAVTDGRHRGVLTALVHLDDFDLLAMLKAQSLTAKSTSAFRLALFNVYHTGAEILLTQHAPFPESPGDGNWHVLVLGFEGVAENLVLSILQRWQCAERHPGARLLITIAGRNASGDHKKLSDSYPKVHDIPDCELRHWDTESFSELQREDVGAPPTAVYVTMAAETQAMSAALRFSARMDIGDTPIVVVLQDETAGMATMLKGEGPLSKHVAPFGLFTQVFSGAAFAHTTNEALAIASHETHVRSQLDAGVTVEQDPSLVPWEELPEALRESNRLFADSFPAKLAAIGCVAQPSRLVDFRRPPVTLTSEEIDLLAPMEHDRWSEDMQRHLGYRKTTGPKDPHRRLHPLIGVPFEQLPKENREKDRAKVRSIAEILARAGFKIARDPKGEQELRAPSTASRDRVRNVLTDSRAAAAG